MATSIVFFSAVDSNGKEGIWETDGTVSGTIEIASLYGQPNTPYYGFSEVNGLVMFAGQGPDGLVDLWVTDGSSAGTKTLAVAGASRVEGLNPTNLTSVGGVVFFNGIDTAGSPGLWISNGTSAGTYEIPGTAGLDPRNFIAYNGELLFTSINNGGLWIATANGAVSEVAGTSGLNPIEMTLFNGKVYFLDGTLSSSPGELYSTDGTAAGTTAVFNLGQATDLTAFGNVLLMVGQDSNGNFDLFKSDGTAAGTSIVSGTTGIFNNLQSSTRGGSLISPKIAVMNGVAYFEAADPNGEFGLWSTNGSSASEITPISGADSSGIFPSTADPDFNGPNFAVLGSQLLFDGVTAGGLSNFGVTGLWSSTGTASGTQELAGVVGAGSSSTLGFDPSNMTTLSLASVPTVTGVQFESPGASNPISGGTVFFVGTVTPGSSGQGVKIYNGSTLIGQATISFGTFQYNANLAAGTYANLRAVVTDAQGQSVSQDAPFSVVLGITGHPYDSLVDTYDSHGALDGQIFFSNSSIYLSDTVTSNANGETIYDYTGGSYFGTATSALAYENVFLYGKFIGSSQVYRYVNSNNAPIAPSYVSYNYSAGGSLLAIQYQYTSSNLAGLNYSGETVSTNPAGQLTQAVYSGLSGAAYSQVTDNFVGGVFAGSTYLFTQTPAGATYSSYEENFNAANSYLGADFFFTISGQTYSSVEERFDAQGKLNKVIYSGFSSGSLVSLENDYNAGVFQDYIASYNFSGLPYANEMVEVNAAGQVTKEQFNGIKNELYSSIEEDFSSSVLQDVIYKYTGVTGSTYYAYQVEDSASGVGLLETFDLNSGGHTLIALAGGQTLTSLGDDKMTGSGATTFVLNPIYGHDIVTNFASGDTISLSTSEFANFTALTGAAQNSGANVLITATNGDILTLNHMNTTTLAGMSASFTFHA